MRTDTRLINKSPFGVLCTLAITAHLATAASFTPLGIPIGKHTSTAAAVSADGNWVVGTSSTTNFPIVSEAFRWSAQTGMQPLGFPAGQTSSDAFGVSSDGRFVVGSSDGVGFRWESGVGFVGLGILTGFPEISPWGIADDGSVLVGGTANYTLDPGGENGPPFRWTVAGGMVNLGNLPGATNGEALAISGDGQVIAGWSGTQAFRKVGSGAMAALGFLPGQVQSIARGLSSDGSVVVGDGWDSLFRSQAFRWTVGGGMQGLGFLAGYENSEAFGVSANGNVVVGDAYTDGFPSVSRAVIWDSTNGLRDLKTVLVGLGVNLTGWTLESAESISSDGTTIVGYGTNPQGKSEAWVARLSGGAVALPASVEFLDDFQQFTSGTDLTTTSYTPASGPAGALVVTSVQNGSPTTRATNFFGGTWAYFDNSVPTNKSQYKGILSATQTNQPVVVTWKQWIQATNSGPGSFLFSVPVQDANPAVTFNPPLGFTDTGTILAFTNGPSVQTPIGNWGRLAGTMMTNRLVLDYPNRVFSYSLNGELLATLPLGSYFTNVVGAIYFNAFERSAGSLGNRFAVDDVKVEVATNSPIVTAPPASQSALAGAAVSLGVAAAGAPPLRYQWFFGQTVLAGATNSTLTLTGVLPQDSGHYRVVITNGLGNVSSSIARLTVHPTNQVLWAMGRNQRGQLGDGTTNNHTSPVPVTGGVSAISAGDDHGLILKSDTSLWAVGKNEYGQLGDGTTIDRPNSLLVASNVTAIAAGDGHNLFVKADATLWVMGRNDCGQLGDGTTNNRATPVQIATGVREVGAGHLYSFFIKTNGTLWAMGLNSDGQLGDGTTNNRVSPVQIATGVLSADGGAFHSLFLKNDGTLWAMGSGQFGNTSAFRQTTPIQVASNVLSTAAGDVHSLFIKTNGTLWAMGNNYDGQLGTGTTNLQPLVPLQVASGVASVSAGYRQSHFIKTNGTLWAMGLNDYGQLGDGTTNNRATPVQIATGVSTVAGGDDHTIFLSNDVGLGIASHPTNLTVSVGGNASFTVSATGFGALSYQWRKDSTNLSNGGSISGATTAMLTLSNVTTNDAGSYTVVVTAGGGSITSNPGVLTVEAFSTSIIEFVTFLGLSNPVTEEDGFSKLVGSDGWVGQLYVGITPNVLLPLGPAVSFETGLGFGFILGPTLTNTSPFSYYQLRVWNATDAATFEGALAKPGSRIGVSAVTPVVNFASGTARADQHAGFQIGNVLNGSATIAIGPTSKTVVSGGSVSFTVSASGIAPLSYRWRKNNVLLSDGAVISGATTATLTISNANNNDAGSYTAVVTGLYGTVATSAPAILTIASSIFNPPASQTAAAIQSQGFGLSLMLETGLNFRVQVNNSLNDGSWADLTNFTSSGTAFQFIDTAATNQSRRFYRVISP